MRVIEVANWLRKIIAKYGMDHSATTARVEIAMFGASLPFHRCQHSSVHS